MFLYMPSYLKNKSDREIEEMIEATTEEKVVEGFGNGGNTALIVVLVLFVVFGLLAYFYILPYLRTLEYISGL